jgi:hypothetical protein
MTIMDSDWWHKPWPTGILLFGLLMLLLAVIGTFTGKAYGKGGTTERAKDPVGFWLILALEYLIGVGFILLWACGMAR